METDRYLDAVSRVGPQPVALAVRRVRLAHAESDRIKATIKAAEIATRYLAIVNLASTAARVEVSSGPPALRLEGPLSFGSFAHALMAEAKIHHPLQHDLTTAGRLQDDEGVSAFQKVRNLLALRNVEGHSLSALDDARARRITSEHRPVDQLVDLLRAFEPVLAHPLIVVERQQLLHRKISARVRFLMGSETEPDSEWIHLDDGVYEWPQTYLVTRGGLLAMSPGLMWDVLENSGLFGVLLLDRVDEESLAYKAVLDASVMRIHGVRRGLDPWFTPKDDECEPSGELIPAEAVSLADGRSIAALWSPRREQLLAAGGHVSELFVVPTEPTDRARDEPRGVEVGTATSGESETVEEDQPADRLGTLAEELELAEDWERLRETAVGHGLYPRPFKNGIMYTPPTDRTRFLIWAKLERAGGGRISLSYSRQNFTQFFPVSEGDVVRLMWPTKQRPRIRAGEGIEPYIESIDRLFEHIRVAGKAAPTTGEEAPPNGLRLRLSGAEASATGTAAPGGFLVERGSLARLRVVPSAPSFVERTRDQLMERGVLTEQGESLRFESSYTAPSPSAAAALVLGRSANGRKEWVDEEGRTLADIDVDEVAVDVTEDGPAFGDLLAEGSDAAREVDRLLELWSISSGCAYVEAPASRSVRCGGNVLVRLYPQWDVLALDLKPLAAAGLDEDMRRIRSVLEELLGEEKPGMQPNLSCTAVVEQWERVEGGLLPAITSALGRL